jgi:ribonuclease R
MKFDPKEIVREITAARSPLNMQKLVRIFRVTNGERREFKHLLAELEHEGRILRVSGKNWTAPTGRSGQIVGRLEVTSKGFGFVRPDWSNVQGKPPFEGDLFIPPRDMGSAMDGDTVRAEVMRRERSGVTGRVTSVLEHAHTRIVGWYQQTGRRDAEVVPRSKRINRRIRVAAADPALAIKDFEWVEVEVTEFTPAPEPLLGRVVSRLGADQDRGIDVLLILRDRGILEEFPKSVEQEVEELRFDWKRDLPERKDYRKLPTITIDPKTAKDFDDALSIERHGDGFRLYVHIADVAHFVRPGTALDREAVDRSTSVYPVDRVVPMLPTKISNFLCSLVPREDRLAVTAVIDLSPRGEILETAFHSSVIHSIYRFDYETVQAAFDWIDSGSREVPVEFQPFTDLFSELKDLRQLAAALRKTRFERGALDLDIPQATVLFGDDGKVSDLKFYPRFESHQLVEECMLIANEAVAQYLTKKQAPLLYRIHEVADEDRLERLQPVLRAFGIQLGRAKKGKITPKDLQRALEQAQGLPAGHIVRRLILRALKRAEYDPANAGHFGLASACYCHFTSPIRRYPDVVVHRQVKALERGVPLIYLPNDNDLEDLGEHTSQRERRAQEAEWEAVSIKSLEFMKRHEGEEMDAYVAGVQNYGLFMELADFPVEGFIPKAALRDDRYDLDDDGYMLVGQRTGRRIKLADKMRVKILKVDPWGQQMDLAPSEQDAPPSRRLGTRFTGKRGGRRG